MNESTAEEKVVDVKPRRTMVIEGVERELEEVDGKLQYKDENNNVFVLSDPNAPKEQPKISKIDLKRMQQRMERRKRLLNKGVPEDKVDQVMADEDWKNTPVEVKLERFVAGFQKAINSLAQDILTIRHNENAIADAMDMNFKAMAKCLVKAGVPMEQQREIIREVEAELRLERQKAIDAQRLASEAQAAAIEKQREEKAQAELAKAEQMTLSEAQVPPQAEPVPEGATTFGG